jgi:hypothetical protein
MVNLLKACVAAVLAVLCVSAFFGLVVRFPVASVHATVGWMGGWGYRIKLTIDKTHILASLANFPIMLHLSSSCGENGANLQCIFGNLTSNDKKLAVTIADGITQCYVEVAKWNWTGMASTSSAYLWVKVPSISSVSNSTLFLYYNGTHADNSAFVGVSPTDTASENVWDSYYVMVQHMNGSSYTALKDSTVNHNNVIAQGSTAPVYGEQAQTGSCVNFTSYSYLNVSDSSSLELTSAGFIEAWVNVPSWGGLSSVSTIVDKSPNAVNNYYGYQVCVDYSGKKSEDCYVGNVTLNQYNGINHTTTIGNKVWFYLVFSWNGFFLDIYENGIHVAHKTQTVAVLANNVRLTIGATTTKESNSYFKGCVNELRLSNLVRSSAYINATYYSELDKLVSYSASLPPPAPYSQTNLYYQDILSQAQWSFNQLYAKKYNSTTYLTSVPNSPYYKPSLLDAIWLYYYTGNVTYKQIAQKSANAITTFGLINPTTHLLECWNGTIKYDYESRYLFEEANALLMLSYYNSTYTKNATTLLNGWWMNAMSSKHLVYENIMANGTHLTICELSYPADQCQTINYFLDAYTITGNATYLSWARQTFDAYWACRNTTTNILPEQVNATTGAYYTTWVETQQVMGDAINEADYLYVMSGNSTYLTDAKKMCSADIQYGWMASSGGYWVYRLNVTGVKVDTYAECCFGMLNYGMLMTWKLTGNSTYYNYAHTDTVSEYLGSSPLLYAKDHLIAHSTSFYSYQERLLNPNLVDLSVSAFLCAYDPTLNYTRIMENWNAITVQFKGSDGYYQSWYNTTGLQTNQPYYPPDAWENVMFNFVGTATFNLHFNGVFFPCRAENTWLDNEFVYLKEWSFNNTKNVFSFKTNGTGTITVHWKQNMSIAWVTRNGLIYANFNATSVTITNASLTTYTIGYNATVWVTPASVKMDVGQSKTFTASVYGGTPPYTYQWYLNTSTQGGNSTTWTFTPSSSGPSLIYVNVTESGGVKLKSNSASVTVSSTLSVSISPTPVTLDVGMSQTFSSWVSGGTSPLAYQWYLNGTSVSGANSSSWAFTPTSAGSYIVYVKVIDSVGMQATSNVATATVPTPKGLTPSVGGTYIPVNKFELLAPYIGLTILLAVAVSTVGYVKKRKRHTEINS